MLPGRILVVACILIIATGCSQTPPRVTPAPAGTLRIYSSFLRSGTAAAPSLEIVRAVDLALAQHNGAGKSPRLEHIQLKSPDEDAAEGSARGEAFNAEIAANDPSAIAYLGPYTSGGASASLPITNKAGLLQIGVSQTWPGLTQPGWGTDEPAKYLPSGVRNYVRLTSPDSVQAEAAVNWAAGLGARDVIIVSDGSTYSDGMRSAFERAAKKQRLNIVGSYDSGRMVYSNVSSELTRLAADTIFYAPSTTGQAVTFAEAVGSASLKAGIFATDTALNDQFAGRVPDTSGSWHIVFNGAAALPDTLQSEDFSQAFVDAYGDQPGIYAAYAYDVTKIIIGSLDSGATTDRATVLSKTLATRNYQGASGNVSFDDRGDPTGWSIEGYVLKDGTFALDRTLVSKP